MASTFFVIASHQHRTDGNQPGVYRRRLPELLCCCAAGREVGLHGNHRDSIDGEALPLGQATLADAASGGGRRHPLSLPEMPRSLLSSPGGAGGLLLRLPVWRSPSMKGSAAGSRIRSTPTTWSTIDRSASSSCPSRSWTRRCSSGTTDTSPQPRRGRRPKPSSTGCAPAAARWPSSGITTASIPTRVAATETRTGRSSTGCGNTAASASLPAPPCVAGPGCAYGDVEAKPSSGTPASRRTARTPRRHPDLEPASQTSSMSPSSTARTIPRIFERECRSLADAGYDVTYLAPDAGSGLRDGVHLVDLPRSLALATLDDLGSAPRATSTACSPDVVHVHDPELLTLFPDAASAGRRPRLRHARVRRAVVDRQVLHPAPAFDRRPLAPP